MPKRASIYARTSYYDSDGDSIDSQLDQCRQYARDNGYEIIAELADHAVSGADMAAPELDRALALARHGHYDVLVTRELDRFARSLTKQLMKEWEFTEAGIAVDYVLGQYEETLEGQLVKHVRAIIAEFSRGKIRERLQRGRVRAAKRGNVFTAGHARYGYDLVTITKGEREIRTLAINDDEARWVGRIYEWYVFGDEQDATPPLSDRGIARRLTELRVKTKFDQRYGSDRRRKYEQGRWSLNTVQRILTSRTYIGEWVFAESGEEIVVPVPAIIDRQLFERAQRKRARSIIRRGQDTRHEYLLRGHVYCAKCGYHLTARAVKGRSKTYLYYRCPGSSDDPHLAHRCDTGNCRSDHVDTYVWRELKRIITDPERLQEALEQTRGEASIERITDQVALLDGRIREQQHRLRRLLDLHLEGVHGQRAVIERQRLIEAEINRLEVERRELDHQLMNTAERLERIYNFQELAIRVTAMLEAAGASYPRRRWIVEALDVIVRLESDTRAKLAHVEADGQYLTTVEIPAKYKQRFK